MQNTDDLQNLFTLTLSISDQRANEVMKILTVFAAFFLPLSFIAGVYGMNFDYMPELRYKWSYFIVLGLMLSVVIVIFIWFKRKKYL
jgi:magnesium transporter